MGFADKCNLNIPFKQYLMSLAQSADGEGKFDREALILAGQREFENYKSIERRINDPSCGGVGGACACTWALVVADGGALTLSGSTQDFIDLDWVTILFHGVEGGTGPEFSLSGGNIVPPAGASGIFRTNVTAGFTDNSGPDPIMATVGQIDNMVTFEDFCYMPDGFPGAVSTSRLVDATGLDAGSTYVTINSPTAATASTTATVYMFVESTCCPPDPGGG